MYDIYRFSLFDPKISYMSILQFCKRIFIYLPVSRGRGGGTPSKFQVTICVIQFASERCFARFKNMNFSQPTGQRLQKTCFFQRVLLRYSFLNLFSLPCIFLRIYFPRIATEQERYIIADNLLVLENIIILFKKSEIFDGKIKCKKLQMYKNTGTKYNLLLGSCLLVIFSLFPLISLLSLILSTTI